METKPIQTLSSDIKSLEGLMLRNINLKTMKFYLAISNSNAFPPLGEIVSSVDDCLNIFMTTGNIKPIQQLTLQTLQDVKTDKLDNIFRAYINLRLSNKYLSLNNYTDALRYYERGITYCNLKDFDDMKNDISSYINKERGTKGGLQKGINYSEPQQKALNYHDKHLNNKNDKGKFIYSNDKAAREIISFFEKKSANLGYTERSLSNIISKHRKGQVKD